MTDTEIIKAFDYCANDLTNDCTECPYVEKYPLCDRFINNDVIDLITRQQSKIDDLMERTAVTTLIDDTVVYTPTLEDYNKFKKKFKSEAVKEFAESIKKLIQTKEFSEDVAMLLCAFIDNISKEMVGENND